MVLEGAALVYSCVDSRSSTRFWSHISRSSKPNLLCTSALNFDCMISSYIITPRPSVRSKLMVRRASFSPMLMERQTSTVALRAFSEGSEVFPREIRLIWVMTRCNHQLLASLSCSLRNILQSRRWYVWWHKVHMITCRLWRGWGWIEYAMTLIFPRSRITKVTLRKSTPPLIGSPMLSIRLCWLLSRVLRTFHGLARNI